MTLRSLTAAVSLSLLSTAAGAKDEPKPTPPPAAAAAAPELTPLTQEQAVEFIREMDKISNSVEFVQHAIIDEKRSSGPNVLREFTMHRRGDGTRSVLMVTNPKVEAGTGFLRLDRNLFFYDPKVGQWERRTERDRIAGTAFHRRDLDNAFMEQEYTPTFEAIENVGPEPTRRILLKAKDGVDVPFQQVRMWVDAKYRIVKKQDMSADGKVLQTTYVPKWQEVYSSTLKRKIWTIRELAQYDEIDKGRVTRLIVKSMEMKPIEAQVFTKAWLERRTR